MKMEKRKWGFREKRVEEGGGERGGCFVEGSGKVVMRKTNERERERERGFGHERGKVALTCGVMPNSLWNECCVKLNGSFFFHIQFFFYFRLHLGLS